MHLNFGHVIPIYNHAGGITHNWLFANTEPGHWFENTNSNHGTVANKVKGYAGSDAMDEEGKEDAEKSAHLHEGIQGLETPEYPCKYLYCDWPIQSDLRITELGIVRFVIGSFIEIPGPSYTVSQE
ncbi:hypothetical protein PSACC_01432 [Paramicrosporidium saccamoebae]|uniref:Uncharacterized protein n=1 Tax=Paramicrosporidium saccamoebae TaxID=1246581 RepID=A0A2H9TLX9_9FUNG|nr:hypothetical protein PSACC_01432 [Paramicrosporidium saccamoebae]